MLSWKQSAPRGTDLCLALDLFVVNTQRHGFLVIRHILVKVQLFVIRPFDALE